MGYTAGAGILLYPCRTHQARSLAAPGLASSPARSQTRSRMQGDQRGMLGTVKALGKQARRALTRRLHPLRGVRARRRLAACSPVRSVLFLCLGNVCRSPYAEASFRRLAPGVRVASAGFIGPGRAPPGQALAVGSEHGVDLSRHVSRIVTQEMARGHDLVVVMAPDQIARLVRTVGRTSPVIALGDLDPTRPGRRAIADPWGSDLDGFRASFRRIDRCLAELAALVTPERRSGATQTSLP